VGATTEWMGMLALVPFGLLAGGLTTVAGVGGGMLLVLGLSLVWGPLTALAVTAPALLLGNAHRAFVYRTRIDRRIALPLVAGALPGSIAGGLLAARMPTGALHALMIAMTALAVVRAAGWTRWAPPPTALAPAGLAIGGISATAGGAGLLLGPLLMASGLEGEAYVSTAAAAAVSMHVGRFVAYGATGLFDAETATRAAVLAACVLGGNLLGVRARSRIPASAAGKIELGALVGCVALSVVGLAG